MKKSIIKVQSNIIHTESNHAKTTSLVIAEKFGKRHDNVLRSIQKLECSKEFSRLNFEGAEYLDDQGKPRLMYKISRDGFMFLVTGFT